LGVTSISEMIHPSKPTARSASNVERKSISPSPSSAKMPAAENWP
jgi:hypothetical protein